MSGRARTVLRALGAAFTLTVITLVSRYAPSCSPDPPRARPPKTGPPAPAPFAPATASAPRAPEGEEEGEAAGPCPSDMTLVDGLACSELELTCAKKTGRLGCVEYARGARCRGKPEPRRYCIDRYEWPNVVGEMPRVMVDWDEAKELCDSVGKRLCRRSEWVLACEGPKRLPYPWGFVRQPSPCNIDRVAVPFDIGALLDASVQDEEIARLWQADPVGSHPDCVSAFGAYDMVGNVDEWTDDEADDPHTKNKATLNGGYWGPVRNTCRLATTTHGPSFRFYQVGFRCCADADSDVDTDE